MTPSSSYPALGHRNFRLLWLGQCVSLPGTLMHNVAVLWHVSLLAEPSQKALALGIVGLVKVVPIVGLSLFGGVLADALDRRRLMLTTQIVLAAIAAGLAASTLSGVQSLWPIYLLTALTSAVGAFDGPARSSLVANLVPREHLSNAVSLNTTMFQLASVIGPALAGVALIWLDVGWVYAINAVSYGGVIVALLAMRDLPARSVAERAPISARSALEGLRFVLQTPLIRASVLLDFSAAFFSTASALLPIFAQDILQVGAAGFGVMCAAPSVGAVLASAYMLRFERSIRRRGEVLLWSVAGYGAATVLFGLSSSFWTALLCLAAIGACDTLNMVVRNVIRQLHTPDEMRGRMSSVSFVFSQGGPQLGELEAGVVAHSFGAPFAVISGGIACMLTSALVAWKTPVLRRYGAEAAARATVAPSPGRTPAGVGRTSP